MHVHTHAVAQCPHLKDPSYGYVKYDEKRTPNTEAHYGCYKGYKRVGVAYRKCSYNCEWLDEAPECIRKSEAPSELYTFII